jgi:hypothetical protein
VDSTSCAEGLTCNTASITQVSTFAILFALSAALSQI